MSHVTYTQTAETISGEFSLESAYHYVQLEIPIEKFSQACRRMSDAGWVTSPQMPIAAAKEKP